MSLSRTSGIVTCCVTIASAISIAGAASSDTRPSAPLTLADALARALEHNPDLGVFDPARRAAEADRLQAGVRPNPEVGASLENFAGTMNFVIFPMFFLSSALYPLWKLRESGAEILYWLSLFNPFTHAVELVRFALYGEVNVVSLAVVVGTATLAFGFAAAGYHLQRGASRG